MESPSVPARMFEIPDDLSDFLEDSEGMALIWTNLVPLFKSHGYLLYPREPLITLKRSDFTPYTLSKDPVMYPFAYASDRRLQGRLIQLLKPTLFLGINDSQRDIVIKLLFNNSEEQEAAILKRLMSEPLRSDPLNTVVPILDLLSYNERYSFVVMPRWGSAYSLHTRGFDCLGTAFEFTLCVLKALTFLHKNLIAHRDIKLDNVLINCYNTEQYDFDYRPFFRSQRTRFVLCDFGESIMFPPDTPPSARLCPASESDIGTCRYHPPDATNGAEMYDPFAFDVACLGGLLCEVIGYMTPLAPLLAPFLDRMITLDLTTRYTAAEALQAFIELMKNYSTDHLATPAPDPPERGFFVWQAHDRWTGLPEDFVREHTRNHTPVKPKRKIQLLTGSSA
ncbi:unnamed protein product [Somion occarium]|uniref:Protein kinase domain-containing protein n=1 Tax=Somion occarium TaxID=3059160 RepID=A0ABP1CRR2_9APHY